MYEQEITVITSVGTKESSNFLAIGMGALLVGIPGIVIGYTAGYKGREIVISVLFLLGIELIIGLVGYMLAKRVYFEKVLFEKFFFGILFSSLFQFIVLVFLIKFHLRFP